nr:hypothetical protein [Tanacetum cinerariifolium]
MVKEEIVLRHKISSAGIKVDKENVDDSTGQLSSKIPQNMFVNAMHVRDPKTSLLIGRNRFLQLNKLVEMRHEDYEHSRSYKERTKRWHDARITDKEFQEGEEVLVFNSRLKIISGKLRTKWLTYLDDTSSLAAALANIIGTTHTLELKSHTYYEHGTFKSFTYWNLIPLEAVVKSAGSSTIDAVHDAPWSLRKRLCKQPSVSTPLKPCEGKTPIRQELEDLDADSLPGRAEVRKTTCVRI